MNEITNDTKLSTDATEFGNLPIWDLSHLYSAETSEELQNDFATLETQIPLFAKDYQGKLNNISANEWLDLLARYEELSIIQGKIISYAGLRYYQNTLDPERAQFLANAQAKLTDLSAHLVFFELEVAQISEKRIQELQNESTEFARFKRIFARMRALQPFQLSDELERFIHDQSVVGASAWNRLFDETMAAMSFEWDDETLGLEALLSKLSEPDRDARQRAFSLLTEKFQANISLFARITNTLAKEKEIEDRWRNLPTPDHSRHMANDVEPEVVDALREAVMAAYPKLSHRYYALKAKWMGLEKMELWDRNAPLPGDDDSHILWDDAKRIVEDAYENFHPKMRELAAPFFTDGWIDAAVKPGKAPGAFAHPTVTSVHPYVMLNYMGKTRDVMTLAHELGHGVHQVLAAQQGELLSSTPLTLAETASVFGEMLTFQKLLERAENKDVRKRLLAGKVEDMLNTVIRQISFYEFERQLHKARKESELTPEQINAIWLKVSKDSLGDSFNYADGYETFWAYIPHFIHSPFYVYAYAFGDGLVNALYAIYQSGFDGFEEKYFDLLRAGGSKHHKELLAPFDLDASDPAFWNKGLDMISGFIDELEKM